MNPTVRGGPIGRRSPPKRGPFSTPNHNLPQRLSGPDAGHAPGQLAAADTQAAAGQLLPAVSGAAQDVGEGPGGRDPGGVDRRRVDPARRRSGAGDGIGRDQQEHGKQAVQGHRRPGECLPRGLMYQLPPRISACTSGTILAARSRIGFFSRWAWRSIFYYPPPHVRSASPR